LLAIGSDSRDTLTLLDPETQQVRYEIPALFDGNMAFSPDGAYLAVGCDDTRVRVWNVASAELLFETDALSTRPTALCFSADGRTLLSAHEDATIRAWHIPSQSPLGILMQASDQQRFAQSLEISPDGRRLSAALHGDFQPSILLSRHAFSSSSALPKSASAGPAP
jgi:WD40 repeat protein